MGGGLSIFDFRFAICRVDCGCCHRNGKFDLTVSRWIAFCRVGGVFGLKTRVALRRCAAVYDWARPVCGQYATECDWMRQLSQGWPGWVEERQLEIAIEMEMGARGHGAPFDRGEV